MKKKLLIDLILFISFILSMQYVLTGNLIHEIVGAVFIILTFVHLIKNRKWIANVTKNIFNKKILPRMKVDYYLDVSIFILFMIATISSIFISKDLLLFLNLPYSETLFVLHQYSSYIMLGLIIIHVILHLNLIFNFIFKKIKSEDQVVFKTVFTFCVMALGFFGFKDLIFKQNTNEFSGARIKKFNSNKYNKLPKEYTSNNTDEVNDNINNDTNVNDNNDDEYLNNDNNIEEDNETLEEYLSKLRCQGCHRNCALNMIRCNRGQMYQEKAKEEYYNTHNVSLNYIDENTLKSTDGEYTIKL